MGVGFVVGFTVGFDVGLGVGFGVGLVVGLAVGTGVGFGVGFAVGMTVGAGVTADATPESAHPRKPWTVLYATSRPDAPPRFAYVEAKRRSDGPTISTASAHVVAVSRSNQ